MKKLFFKLLLLISISSIALTSCQKEDVVINPNIMIEVEGKQLKELNLPYGESIILKAKVKDSKDFKVIWTVNGKQSSTNNDFEFKADKVGKHTIVLTIINQDGGKSTDSIIIDVENKYKHGTIILNEGNMSNENGSITFISPKGVVTDSAYYKVNKSYIGNVVQDLYIDKDRMYLISQNGNKLGGDGILVIANAETLKKEIAYNDELKSLSWPTHISAIGKNIYIRDNNGLHLFNTETKELKYIEGSKGAMKNRMAVVGNKVFVPGGKYIFVVEGDKMNKIEMPGTISGIIKSSDNNLFVSCTTNPAQISKVDASDYSIIQTNKLGDAKVSAGWGASPGISAKGDTIYFSNASTKIYRHIFSKNETKYMVDVKEEIEDANIVYNNLAVHPKTGNVYFNTLKAWSEYKTNSISEFDFSQNKAKLTNQYRNHTHFPAGIFFTDSFK